MIEVLDETWKQGIFTKGNMARSHANPIAEAASRGWITTSTQPTVYGNLWLITEEGLGALNNHKQEAHTSG